MVLVLALEVLQEGVQHLQSILLLLAANLDPVGEIDILRLIILVVHLCAENFHLQGALRIAQVRLHDAVVELHEIFSVESDAFEVLDEA